MRYGTSVAIVAALSCGVLLLTPTNAFAPISTTTSSHNIATTGIRNTNQNRKSKFSTSRIHLEATSSPTTREQREQQLADGVVKTVLKEGYGAPLQMADIATVKYKCYLTEENGFTFASSPRQKVIVGDGAMIGGWEVALPTMNVGERSIVSISSSASETHGYGEKGIPPIVPSMAAIEMEIEVLETEERPTLAAPSSAVVGAAGDLIGGVTGSGELGAIDPSKPRTPQAIADAYKIRQDQMATENVDKKEGIEGFIEKAKTFYFFGLFEGETGQQAPWYLRPSITFPLAFAIVGGAFYVLYLGGGINQRGAQLTDELDEIILSSLRQLQPEGSATVVRDSIILALAFMGVSSDNGFPMM